MRVFEVHQGGRFGAGSAMARDDTKECSYRALMEWSDAVVHVGVHDPVARMAVLGKSGIDGQIIVPSTIGLVGKGLGTVDDLSLSLCSAEARRRILGENARTL